MSEFKNVVLLTQKMEQTDYCQVLKGDCYLFLLFHTSVAVSYDGKDFFHAPKNSVIVYTPGTMQYYKNIDYSFLNSFLAFDTDASFFKKFHFPLNRLFIISQVFSDRILYILDRLSYVVNTPYAKEFTPRIPDFIENVFSLTDEAYLLSSDNTKPENPQFVTLFNIRNKMIDDPIKYSPKEMSKLFGYSEAYFCKKYKYFFNSSPLQDRKKLIVSLIKKYLETTDLSLEKIAEECGISSIPHLISLFKSSENITPHQYRINVKRHINGKPEK